MPLPERAIAFGRPRTPLCPIEGGAPTVAEIKADLIGRVSRIPDAAWQRFFPDREIPVCGNIRDAQGRYVVNHSEIEYFLYPDGVIREKLINYADDGYDSIKQGPDVLLGEINERAYVLVQDIAINALEVFERRARRVGIIFEQVVSQS